MNEILTRKDVPDNRKWRVEDISPYNAEECQDDQDRKNNGSDNDVNVHQDR